MIEIRNLCHAYKNADREVRAVDNVSMTVEKGKTTCIIGHTGSGKSTLIQHLNGLLKPTSGEVLLDGVNIFGKDVKMKDVRRRVGLVFQYPEYQLFEETVYKDIAFAPKNYGLSEQEIKEKVYAAAKTVGLKEKYMEKSPFELSGGQKRRVAIAGVLAMEPEVLVLDEPAAGLDPFGREKILYEIEKIRTERGISVVLVSHSMEDVAKHAHKVCVMHKGKLALSGTPEEVFSDSSRLERMRLDVPQIAKILSEMRKMGIAVPTNIFSVKEAADWILQNKEIIKKG